MTIGWGVITTGRHPDQKIVPAIKLADDAELVAVYGRDMDRAEAFAKKHGVPTAYDDLDDLLGDSRIDSVFIASPNHLHRPHTCKSAEKGKHILVEKPMAISIDDAVEMVRTCRKHKVKLGVGFQLRHHPGIIKARELVQEGILGLITMAQAQFFFLNQRGVSTRAERNALTRWWEEPEKIGGSYVLMGMGVHAIDTLQFLLDQPITEVATITDGQPGTAHIDDTAALVLRFRDGMLGTVCCGRFAPDTRNDAVVYGSNGRILLKDAIWERCGGSLEVASETVNLSESFEPNLLTLYKRQIEAFNRAIRDNTEFNASGTDGLSVVQVATAAVESASTGRSVKMEPIQI